MTDGGEADETLVITAGGSLIQLNDPRLTLTIPANDGGSGDPPPGDPDDDYGGGGGSDAGRSAADSPLYVAGWIASSMLLLAAAAAAADWYGRQTLQGEGTGWWDKEGFPLAPPLESCRRTASPSWLGGTCTWMVALQQPTAGTASFELIDLNSSGWNRKPFTVSPGQLWEFEVSDRAEDRYDPKWVVRTDSPEPWTLVFTKKESGAAYLHGADFKAEFSVNTYRQPTDDPFDFCDYPLCLGKRFGGSPASWSSRKAALFWTFDPENPEVLVKVLDGRAFNGHWWLDLAVTSDLYATTTVYPAATGSNHAWVFVTGRAAAFGVTGEYKDRLIHCFYPYLNELRPGQYQCWKAGLGTSVSLRDLWDSDGRIPPNWCDYKPARAGSGMRCFKPPGLGPPRLP